jgi:hypothetical protein
MYEHNGTTILGRMAMRQSFRTSEGLGGLR